MCLAVGEQKESSGLEAQRTGNKSRNLTCLFPGATWWITKGIPKQDQGSRRSGLDGWETFLTGDELVEQGYWRKAGRERKIFIEA